MAKRARSAREKARPRAAGKRAKKPASAKNRHLLGFDNPRKEMLEMKVRAEQQALAKWGLNYVIEEYLPRKLRNPRRFLP